LPDTDSEGAAQAGEAVRLAFAASAAEIDGAAVRGTVSVGGASSVDVDRDFSTLFRRADAALYAAKHAGRNRVELLGPEDAANFEALRNTIRLSRIEREAPAPSEAA
jgi:diguanylate cyclase (GGDEF)-like protein